MLRVRHPPSAIRPVFHCSTVPLLHTHARHSVSSTWIKAITMYDVNLLSVASSVAYNITALLVYGQNEIRVASAQHLNISDVRFLGTGNKNLTFQASTASQLIRLKSVTGTGALGFGGYGSTAVDSALGMYICIYDVSLDRLGGGEGRGGEGRGTGICFCC